MTGTAFLAGLALGVAGAAGALALEAGAPAATGAAMQTPIALTGHDWARLGAEERGAYLAGFIAGAAAHQATGGRTTTTGARAAAAAARLKDAGTLAFPFGDNVYRSHLDDYFFYRDRRAQTLIQALVELNNELRVPK